VKGPLGVTYGKHGYLPLPVVRESWADTPALTVLGALLLAAAFIAWAVVLP
jgi:hypothetical protein